MNILNESGVITPDMDIREAYMEKAEEAEND